MGGAPTLKIAQGPPESEGEVHYFDGSDMHGKRGTTECEENKQPACPVTICKLGNHKVNCQGVQVYASRS
jgi:hypothetical protein